MPDPTITDQPDLPPIQDLPAAEYREVRGGKTVAEVVAARPEPPADSGIPPPEAAGAQLPRDKDGRFLAKAVDPVVDAAIADRAPASKAANPRHNPQARIDELTKEKGDAVRRAEVAEADRERYRLEVDAYKRGEGPKPEPVASKPEPVVAAVKLEYPADLKSYEAYAEKNPDATYEEYMDARGDFRYDHHTKAQHAEQTALSAREQRLKPFKERETAFKATTADYDHVIQSSPVFEMPLPPWVIEEVLASEQGPALRYYLAQHPDETAWLAAQPKAAAVAFLKSLFMSAPVAPAVTTGVVPKTKADPPFETVGASAAASTHSLETIAATGSAADFRRHRESGGRR